MKDLEIIPFQDLKDLIIFLHMDLIMLLKDLIKLLKDLIRLCV